MKKIALNRKLIFLLAFFVLVFCSNKEARAGDGMVNGQWVAPIGILTPSFGITETYRMYDTVENRNSSLTYLESASGGYYTHYVDRSGACSDTSNNGTSGNPRCTIPASMPAGSILEIHNAYNYAPVGYDEIISQGTINQPVFVRGVNSNITRRIVLRGIYLIVENLVCSDEDGDLSGGNTGGMTISVSGTTPIETHHIALRNNNLSGNLNSGGLIVSSYHAEYWITDVVIYNNAIHNNGDYNTTVDQDVHGIGVGAGVNNLWVVDNEMYHNSGNGIQVNGGSANSNIQHVYIGRNNNQGFPNRQSFVGIKQSQDVIVSENHVWYDELSAGLAPSRHTGMVFQYGPERLWIIYNNFHDARQGISAGSNSVAVPGENTYIVGNLIHNIAPDIYDTYNPNTAWAGAGMMLAGGVTRHIIGNTLYNVCAGINTASGGTFIIANNIISELNRDDTHHIWLETRLGTPNSVFYNNLFYQSNRAVDIRWGDYHGDVSAFESLAGSSAQNNIDAEPLFSDILNNDFTIQETSPAINAGIVSDVYQTFFDLYGIDITKDITGTVRSQGGTWDIGAYEYDEGQVGDATAPNSPTNLSVL